MFLFKFLVQDSLDNKKIDHNAYHKKILLDLIQTNICPSSGAVQRKNSDLTC